MTVDDMKALALKQCIEIYRDYAENEVRKWAPPSVQMAWGIGKEYLESQRKADEKRLKNFTL